MLTPLKAPTLALVGALCAVLIPATFLAPTPSQNTDRPPTTHNNTVSTRTVEGWHVPWAIGGPRWNAKHEVVDTPPEWPAFPVHAIRLWDTRTAWLNLNPARGVYDWTNLDNHIAAAHAHGVTDITLVIAGTPAWATDRTSRSAASWMGPSSASPPTTFSDWDTFITALATRYRGTITGYELGNEPSNPLFWNGTPQELAGLTDRAARIIHAIDPAAALLPAADVLSANGIPGFTRDYWTELARRGTPLTAVTLHYYPDTPATVNTDLLTIRKAIKQAAPKLPRRVWITELNYTDFSNTTLQHSVVFKRTVKAANKAGISRIYWYAYIADHSTGLLLPGQHRP